MENLLFTYQLDIILKWIAIIAASFGGIWATSKYIIERGYFPAAQMDIECRVVGQKDDFKILEAVVHINNKGTTTLIAKNICLTIKILGKDDPLLLYTDQNKFGRLKFNYPSDINRAENKFIHKIENVRLVPWNTFIQPGVNQKYPYATILAKQAEFIFVESRFEYVRTKNPVFLAFLGISWVFGLIPYSLKNIEKPHTAQAVFNLKAIE